MKQSFNKATDVEKLEVQDLIKAINIQLNLFVRNTIPEDRSNKHAPWLGFSNVDTTLIKKYQTYFRNYYKKFGWILDLEPNIKGHDFIFWAQSAPIASVPKTLVKNPDEPYHSYHTQIRSKYASEFTKILQIFKHIQTDRINNTWPLIESYEKIFSLEYLLKNVNYSIDFNYCQNLGYDHRQESMFIFSQWLAEEFKTYGWYLTAKIPGPYSVHKENQIEFKIFPIRDETLFDKYFTFGPILCWPEYREKILEETNFQLILIRNQEYNLLRLGNGRYNGYILTVPKNLKERLTKEFRKLKIKIKFEELHSTQNLIKMLID